MVTTNGIANANSIGHQAANLDGDVEVGVDGRITEVQKDGNWKQVYRML